MYIDKNELLEAIKEKYGEYSHMDMSGCNILNTDTKKYEWLSTQAIIELIESCTEYEE